VEYRKHKRSFPVGLVIPDNQPPSGWDDKVPKLAACMGKITIIKIIAQNTPPNISTNRLVHMIWAASNSYFSTPRSGEKFSHGAKRVTTINPDA